MEMHLLVTAGPPESGSRGRSAAGKVYFYARGLLPRSPGCSMAQATAYLTRREILTYAHVRGQAKVSARLRRCIGRYKGNGSDNKILKDSCRSRGTMPFAPNDL